MLRRYTWEKVRDKCQHYRRRAPETSTLYQIVFHGRQKLEHCWEEKFQSAYGALRDEVLSVLDKYLNCGLLSNGAARVYCDSCKHSLLVAFSCKKRGVCPSCSSKRTVIFAEHLYDEVLEDVPTRHIVFSIPKRLRLYFRYSRSLCDILFKAAWRSVEEHLSLDDAIPALVLTLQTAGEALNWNPHLHGMLADGTFSPGGTFTAFSEINLKDIEDRFAELVLSSFAKLELITDDVMSQVLSQEHSGFSVWAGEPFQDEGSEKFVARYVERGPISLEKLTIQDDIVTYTTKDGAAHEFDAVEFLALLSSHIPKPYESITRYYGWYSCRSRGDRNKSSLATSDEIPEQIHKPSSSWARCIKQIYELDPLVCPRCKSQMRIIAFVHDPLEIKKIMDSLGLPQFRAPPPIPEYTRLDAILDDIPDYDV